MYVYGFTWARAFIPLVGATLSQWTWRLLRRSMACQFQVFRSFYFLIDIIEFNRNFHGYFNFSSFFFTEINLLQGDTFPLNKFHCWCLLLVSNRNCPFVRKGRLQHVQIIQGQYTEHSIDNVAPSPPPHNHGNSLWTEFLKIYRNQNGVLVSSSHFLKHNWVTHYAFVLC